jgi:predicted dehydrogenase
MKILIVGLGSVGRRHMRNLVALGEHDLVLLRSGKSTLPEDELHGYPVVTEIDAALRLRPQAAVIATPTSLHLQSAIPLARAGCHLLIEKPVSHTMEGVAELQAAQSAGGGQVMVAFQYRHHPGLQAIRRWLTRDLAAVDRAPTTATTCRLAPLAIITSPLPRRPGVVVRILCHLLDYLVCRRCDARHRWTASTLDGST